MPRTSRTRRRSARLALHSRVTHHNVRESQNRNDTNDNDSGDTTEEESGNREAIEQNESPSSSFLRDHSPEGILKKIKKIESRFKSSCQQIVLLNLNLDNLQLRYGRAVNSEQRSFRYSLRLRMAVLEGIRNMYYEHACRKAEELTKLRCLIVGSNENDSESVASLDTSDSDD